MYATNVKITVNLVKLINSIYVLHAMKVYYYSTQNVFMNALPNIGKTQPIKLVYHVLLLVVQNVPRMAKPAFPALSD